MSCSSSLELLECRIAPAGVVKVTLTAGVLSLEGDAAANDVTVEATASGLLSVTGNHGTQISFAGVTDTSASVTLPVASLTGDLGGGDDVLSVKNLHLDKDLTVTDSAGNNTVNVANVSAGGSLAITTSGTIALAGSVIGKWVMLNGGYSFVKGLPFDVSNGPADGGVGGEVSYTFPAAQLTLVAVATGGVASESGSVQPIGLPAAGPHRLGDSPANPADVSLNLPGKLALTGDNNRFTASTSANPGDLLFTAIGNSTVSLNVAGHLDALILSLATSAANSSLGGPHDVAITFAVTHASGGGNEHLALASPTAPGATSLLPPADQGHATTESFLASAELMTTGAANALGAMSQSAQGLLSTSPP